MNLKKRKINFFLVGYTLALTLLAVVGYNVANQKWGVDRTHSLDSPYFSTDLALYDLPRINVSMPNTNGQTVYVRIDITLEVAKKDLERLDGFKPRITNRIMNYMRGQKLEEIKSPLDQQGLHSRILREVDATQPIPVHDIIFRQFVLL